MYDDLLDEIKNVYKENQKKRRDAISIFASGYFSRAQANEQRLWSKLYDDTPLGPKVHNGIRNYVLKTSVRCAYCQDRIFHNANFNIDHVLPSAIFPQFTFTPQNLVAACVTCNAIKKETNFYTATSCMSQYPLANYSWGSFHPKLHLYNDHIRMIFIHTNHFAVRAFMGKSPEGVNLCKNFLKEVTEFTTKSPANPSIAHAVDSLQNFISSYAIQPGTNLQNILNQLIKYV
ncbi:HNH endonuclease [Acetobacter vaccinii]|uniref:HNH endonuclease n=1 Tax=Acetobacter vaccinii TaxID=2592655 RepID=A0A5C1YR62_9PROT|nr:HNH endonuclease [Acetobacter vaccinii]